MYKMLDTSNPGNARLPKGYQAVAGYIGGDTPHVWTDAQWANFRGVPKLPIWVNSLTNGQAAGEADGWACVKKLFDLGVPSGKAVAYDRETLTDREAPYGFAKVLNYCGFVVWLYGSRSTVLTIPFNDYWVADYTNHPHWPVRSSRACQYKAGVTIDGVQWDVGNIRRWQLLTHRLWK